MLRNYFKIALRNLFNNKIYSFINIAGLAIGLAAFILIATYIKNELSYDKFHKTGDRIYRPVEIQHHPGVGTQHVAVTMAPLAPALESDFPEVARAVRIRPMYGTVCQIGDRGFYENGISLADPSIFDIFTIPLIEGNPQTALKDPFSIILSEESAAKYFGEKNPLGKTITIHHYFGADEFKITGIMKNYPQNSHLNFTMLGSFASLEGQTSMMDNWHSNWLATYIMLKEGHTAAELEKKFPEFIAKYIPDEKKRTFELYLQPLQNIHLRSGHILYQTFNHLEGSIDDVYTFTLIAIFILLIACINFMNLATARSAKRAREVGIRKVLGSLRKQLIFQFLGESIIISFVGLVIAVVLAQLALPYFKSIMENRLIFSFYEDWTFFPVLIAIALIVGIIAGSYPAFYLSALQPVRTLKSGSVAFGSAATLRKVLVVLQFGIAIALIVNTGVILDQMKYIRTKELGYNKEQVVYLPLRGKDTLKKVELLKTELLKNANIMNTAAASGLSGGSGSQGTFTVADTNEEVKLMMRHSYVDFDYIETMQMNIMQGRNFSRDFSTDTSAVIINETAVRELGWTDPLGKQFQWGDEGERMTVIGVVNDYHFYSLHHKIEPLIMWIAPGHYSYLLIRIAPQNITATMEYVENIWKEQVPGRPFEYSFLEEHFDQIYKGDENTGRMFASFASLAILIACLGLFGLSAFTVEQKTKEIGIRKVLGASVSGIVMMLSKEFVKWVTLGSLIAFPFAYFFAQDWLGNFVYRTEINYLVFLVAALLGLLIALLTVSYQAVKASLSNPVNSLRYE
jgi:putative ABC transport system permease protein